MQFKNVSPVVERGYLLKGYRTEKYLKDLATLPVKEGFKYKVHVFNVKPYVSSSLTAYIFGAVRPKPVIDRYGVEYSLCKRIGRKPPGCPTHAMYARLRRFVHAFCVKNLTPLEEIMSFDEWLEKSKYPMKKQEEFRVLRENYRIEDVKKAKVKCFLKDEAYNEFKALRMICSREDSAKVWLGPIFKSIEEVVFKLPFFVKGLTEQERVEKLVSLFGERTCYVTDYSAFETHFVYDLMVNCEMVMYSWMLKNFPEELEAVKVILGKNKLESKVFHGTIEAVRMSGECNTSLGNGFSNAMLMLFFCHENGIEVGNFVVEGDDGLFELSREISPREFEPYGLNLKIERTVAHKSSFCGCIYNPVTHTNFGDVIRHCVDMGWSSKKHMNLPEKRQNELLHARAFSFCAQYPGVPILWKMCSLIITKLPRVTFCRAYKYLDRYKQQTMPVHLVERVIEPNLDDRYYMEEVFGVSVEDQLRIEKDFEETFPHMYSHTFLEHVPEIWRDCFLEYAEERD